MKKLIIILAILIYSFKSEAQPSLLSQLQNFPLANYLNKPIDTLLANLPSGYDTAFFITSSGHIQRGASLQVNYMPNFNFWICIDITSPQFITEKRETAIPPEIAWPIQLLRKEKIRSITIFRLDYRVINEASL
jgi:hypothetical protein